MCCGCPEPQGGAHSTDTGPAHEPAVGSLPAAENTQHTVYMQKNTGDGKEEFCRNSFYVTQIEHAVSQIFTVEKIHNMRY